MGISTGLPQRSLRKSERERVQDDGGNPLSVVNVELRAFKKRNRPTDRKKKQKQNIRDGIRRWINCWGVNYEYQQPSMTSVVMGMFETWDVFTRT